MISVTAAIQQIAACRTNWGSESIPLEQSTGRVLATAITADRDHPPFHRAACDGFALRITDYLSARQKHFPVSHTIKAGETASPYILPGHAAKVFAGAILPEDADVVIKSNDAEEINGHVSFGKSNIRIYHNILRKGTDATEGRRMLEAGTRIQFPHLALLASLGVASVKVYTPPRVVIVSIGNGLRLLGAPLTGDQIWDVNSYTVNAMLQQYGIETESRFIVPEQTASLEKIVAASLDADLLIMTGGEEILPRILQNAGVEQVFHRVRTKPCKPFWFGYSPTKTRVMVLPADPFAVQTGSKLFLESYIRACWSLPMVKPWLLPYTFHREAVATLDEYLPALLVHKNGLRVRDVASAAQADGIICHATDMGTLEPGSLVPFYPWVDTQV